MIEREIDGDFSSVRTTHQGKVSHLQATQNGGKVISRKISFRRRRGSAVSAAIVADGMEVLAEFRPNVIPCGRVQHSIVDQDYGLRRVPTFFEIQLGCSHLNK